MMNMYYRKFLHSIFSILFLQGFILPLNAQGGYFASTNNNTYVEWLESVSYNKSTFISSTYDTNNGVAVHWNIQDDMIHLAVVAQATGWSAFGLAESGSMRGADIIMYEAVTNTLTDSYVLDQLVVPMMDTCQSWELVNSVVDGGFIIFEAKRPLDTGDSQDRVISDDSLALILPTRVIAAWGDSTQPSYHGRNVARGTIRFFGAADMIDEEEFFAQLMQSESEGSFPISARNFSVPSDVVTTYNDFCFSREDLIKFGVPMDQDLHTIGFEPFVQPGNEPYVHHFVLYGSESPWNNSLNCDVAYPKIENAYTWAPGDLPLSLPANVGGPLGSQGYQSYLLEIHYNNFDLKADITDDSGVRIHYTSIKREFDLGIFQVGDPFVALENTTISPLGGFAQHTFTCEEQCLDNHLTQPVTVFREHLHMHMTGVSMVNYHIRDEQVIRQGRVDFWDFAQQGDLGVVQPPFQIKPGDSFQTVCNFNSENTVQWGYASEQEMCIAFLYYYPRQVTADQVPLMCGIGFEDFIPGCEVTYSVTPDFTTVEQLERTFGNAPSTCPNSMSAPNASPVQIPVPAPTSGSITLFINVGYLVYAMLMSVGMML